MPLSSRPCARFLGCASRELIGRTALTIFGIALAMAAVLGGAGCLPRSDDKTTLSAPFQDDFARKDLGPQWVKRGGSWRILDDALSTSGDHNIPLWLDVPLPTNVRVEVSVMSRAPQFDAKLEIFGDGVRHESGYIVILGGWNNTITTIARLNEHERTRVEVRRPWEPNRKYRWKVERTNGKDVVLSVDDVEIVRYVDTDPLVGRRNNRLAFTSWESDVRYDDLVITPLP